MRNFNFDYEHNKDFKHWFDDEVEARTNARITDISEPALNKLFDDLAIDTFAINDAIKSPEAIKLKNDFIWDITELAVKAELIQQYEYNEVAV